MDLRPHIREFIRMFAQSFPVSEPIVEIGSKKVQGQEIIGNLRSLFPNKEYIGCDFENGDGVDRIEDVTNLTFADGEAGTLILADTVEHVVDIEKAFDEIARCLNKENGLLLVTSVMNFPIHGYPNDYWRFTPESFRVLARRFPCSAVFFAGDPHLPHTVCLIAGAGGRFQQGIRTFTDAVGANRVLAPPLFEALASRVIRNLTASMVEGEVREPLPESEAMGRFGAELSNPNWFLVPGMWIKLEVECVGILRLELRVNGKRLMTVKKEDLNRISAVKTSAVHECVFQLEPVEKWDEFGRIEAYAFLGEGDKRLICRSAPGHILGTVENDAVFHLHSMDNHEPTENAMVLKSRSLIEILASRGEKVVADLGCGFRKQGNIGVDSTFENTQADVVCLAGIEPLPFDDGSVDEFVCRDFLEHIPKSVFLESKRRFHFPVIYLMNEIWRVLKPGGFFRSWTPCYPHDEVFQDPTHVSAWTPKSMRYFCGDYPVAVRVYGVNCQFEIVEENMEGFYYYALLRKPVQN